MKLKFIISVVYFFLLGLLIRPWSSLVVIVAGGLLGLFLLWLDELKLSSYYNDEPSANSPNRPHSLFLATRSALFMVFLIPLSLFVITSTGSALGVGLVLGLFLGLVIEVWQFKTQPALFKQRFWSQIKTNPNQQQIMLIWLGLAGYLCFLTLLTLTIF